MDLTAFLAAQKKDTLEKLKEEISTGGYVDFLDGRRWKPTFPKDGSVEYIIRFLPSSNQDAPDFQELFKHYIEHNGNKLYITCPTTLGKSHKCPVCESNKAIWDSDEETARNRKRQKTYFANVFIVADPVNPENNGKIFVYEMPLIVKRMIDDCVTPPKEKSKYALDGEARQFDPFNIFTGANLHLKMAKVGGYWKYDKTYWKPNSELTSHTDMTLEEVFANLYDISTILKQQEIKSYEEISEDFNRVLGATPNKNTLKMSEPSTQVKTTTTRPKVSQPTVTPVYDDSEDDIMSEIDSLLQDSDLF